MPREFRWGAQILPDPDDEMTPDEVRAFYAHTYPELLNAAVIQEGESGSEIITLQKPEPKAIARPAAKPAGGSSGSKESYSFKESQGKRG